MGKARETAVRAASLYWARNMLSTTLYKAWTIMLSMMGKDMESTNVGMGLMPILFS